MHHFSFCIGLRRAAGDRSRFSRGSSVTNSGGFGIFEGNAAEADETFFRGMENADFAGQSSVHGTNPVDVRRTNESFGFERCYLVGQVSEVLNINS